MNMERRPIKTRGAAWAQALAATLAKMGVTPNQISLMSIAFAAGSFILFTLAFNSPSRSLFLLTAVLCAQARLLCNLFDGMVAVEHNQTSVLGEIYNDAPDRIADLLIIVGSGYAIRDIPFAIELGWLGGALAISTAYIRVLGKSLGTQSFFIGPMAKPHRMALITFAAILEIGIQYVQINGSPLFYSLVILNIGALLTIFRRLKYIADEKRRIGA